MRTPALVLLAFAPALAGCLEGFGASPDFGDLTLEGTIQGVGESANWTAEALNVTVDAPPLILDKRDIPPTGGGGVTRDLEAAQPSVALRVRLREAARLADYEVEWQLRGPDGITMRLETLPGHHTFAANVTGLGEFRLRAEVGRGLRVDTEVSYFSVRLNAHWSVESSVFPLRIGSGPYPPNYDQMADVFRFEVPAGRPTARAITAFRGAYEATNGTDVDLELSGAGRRVCIGSGGGSGQTPDPAQASETLHVPSLGEGTWTVRVGAISRACGGNPWYHNVGPVPYGLDLWVYARD